jgi:hypothetical protein
MEHSLRPDRIEVISARSAKVASFEWGEFLCGGDDVADP